MTEQEKQEIVSDVEKQILEKMKGTVIREDTQSVLKKPRSKWFTSASCNTESIMYKLFGTYVYWSVWDMIRKLTCYICGTSYVRNLSGNEMADEVAEKLCQFVYDLRTEYLEHEAKK